MLLLFVVIILNSYALPPAHSGDVTQLRDAQRLIVDQSHISEWVKQVLAPTFLHILSPLLPNDLVSLFH
jgi:hypothetical protein